LIVFVTVLTVFVTVGPSGFGSFFVTLVTVFVTVGTTPGDGEGVGDGVGVLPGLPGLPGPVPGEDELGEVPGWLGAVLCVQVTARVLELWVVALPARVSRAVAAWVVPRPLAATTGNDFAAAAGSCVAVSGAGAPGPAKACPSDPSPPKPPASPSRASETTIATGITMTAPEAPESCRIHARASGMATY
jgi:hypothetical protein